MESAIMDKPDASSATDDEHQESSLTADGRFSFTALFTTTSRTDFFTIT